jgi:hypothetical protein
VYKGSKIILEQKAQKHVPVHSVDILHYRRLEQIITRPHTAQNLAQYGRAAATRSGYNYQAVIEYRLQEISCFHIALSCRFFFIFEGAALILALRG